MIAHVALLLALQLVVEVITLALGLPIPGPVLGMALLLALLFVPAGVGIITHLDRLAESGLGLIAALILNTWAALIVGAWTFIGLAKLSGSKP